jgi:hypothetical protein
VHTIVVLRGISFATSVFESRDLFVNCRNLSADLSELIGEFRPSSSQAIKIWIRKVYRCFLPLV